MFGSSRALLQIDQQQPQVANTFPFSRPAAAQPPLEYAKLRSACPVSTAKLFDGSPIWLITKLGDLQAVLTNDSFSKVRTHPGFPELSPGAKAAVEGHEPTFVDMDPPDHTKFRRMFEFAYTPEEAERMKPGIQHKADELIDAIKLGRSKGDLSNVWQGTAPQVDTRQGRAVDLHEAFSLPFAFKVIYEMLGIPPEDYQLLSSSVAVRASGSSTARDAAAAQEDLLQYMLRLVDHKEMHPGRDLVSELIRREMKPGDITRKQLAAHAFLLLVAGNATVASMIDLGVLTLLQHPSQLQELKSNPNLWPAAVEELCRYHTASAYALRRVALQDVQVQDQTIRAGQGVICLNQSANRDADVFPDPDKFDIHRATNPHVAFGYGPHVCVAQWLARLELEIALQSLFIRLDGLRLAVPEDELRWSPAKKDVGVLQLPVRWND
eukprot:gene10929-11084_t